MEHHPDEGLFEIFSGSFFGYGQYASPVWFVGPYAEFLGTDPPEIARRLETWHRRGQRPTVDLKGISSTVGDGRWHGEAPRLHRVWSKLARVALAMEGRDVNADVRTFQANELGRIDGRYAMLHLLAVDARPDASWPYRALETAHLRRPDLYAERFTERRARQIARKIERHRPATVFFYDITHRRWWEEIAGGTFQKSDVKNCFVARSGDTTFLIMRHPESIGTRNEYFARCGSLAARLAAAVEPDGLPTP